VSVLSRDGQLGRHRVCRIVIGKANIGKEMVNGGAKVVTAGKRTRATVSPAILMNVPATCHVSCQEAFGPVVAVYAYDYLETAIEQANNTPYGLPGIFTPDPEGVPGRASGSGRQQRHPDVPRGPHAVWRREGERHGPGRPEVRHRRDDGDEVDLLESVEVRSQESEWRGRASAFLTSGD
jgi:hypothetical protein